MLSSGLNQKGKVKLESLADGFNCRQNKKIFLMTPYLKASNQSFDHKRTSTLVQSAVGSRHGWRRKIWSMVVVGYHRAFESY